MTCRIMIIPFAMIIFMLALALNTIVPLNPFQASMLIGLIGMLLGAILAEPENDAP
jgi:hypothetical protein